jgi:tetratricopeptide (TPR) repeat protein
MLALILTLASLWPARSGTLSLTIIRRTSTLQEPRVLPEIPPPLPSPQGVLQPPGGIEVFHSYSHKDESLRNELEKHLSPLRRQGIISTWHDRKIGAGTEWAGQIDAHINTAGVILLLISADFLASHYCWDVEMQRAMERHDAGEARVIPIILRPCVWKEAPFGKLQALPRDARPVTKWGNRDEALAEIATGIRAAAHDLSTKSLRRDISSGPIEPFDERAVESYRRGVEKGNSGDYRGALHEFNDALRLNSDYDQAYRDRGLARYYLKDGQGAIEDWSHALRINSADAVSYARRGWARYEADDRQDALDDFNQALRLDPEDSWTYTVRGWTRYEGGDRKGALEDFDEAICLNPNNAIAHINRGLVRHAGGDRRGAIEDFNQALEIDPNSGMAYYNRALVRNDRGDRQSALGDLEMAAGIFSNDGDMARYRQTMDAVNLLRR